MDNTYNVGDELLSLIQHDVFDKNCWYEIKEITPNKKSIRMTTNWEDGTTFWIKFEEAQLNFKTKFQIRIEKLQQLIQ